MKKQRVEKLNMRIITLSLLLFLTTLCHAQIQWQGMSAGIQYVSPVNVVPSTLNISPYVISIFTLKRISFQQQIIQPFKSVPIYRIAFDYQFIKPKRK